MAQQESVIIDGLNAVFPRNLDEKYIDSLQAGGVTGIHITVPDVESFSVSYVVDELTQLFYNIWTLKHRGVRLATTASELRQAKREGGVAVILGSQGAGFLGQDLNTMEFYYQLGMRVMQPTYQTRNQFGSGCGEKHDGGLSNLGAEWVARMNDLGMLISLSHVGPRTSMEAMAASKHPVVFTHSNPKAICDHVRNISDEHIKACAEGGGVVGLTTIGMFLSNDKKLKDITLQDFIKHVEYVEKMAGIDHVGVGLDIAEGFTYSAEDIIKKRRLMPTLTSKMLRETEDEFLKSGRDRVRHDELYVPPWLQHMSDFPVIAKGLAEAGYSQQQVQKILGENFLRVFESVWGG